MQKSSYTKVYKHGKPLFDKQLRNYHTEKLVGKRSKYQVNLGDATVCIEYTIYQLYIYVYIYIYPPAVARY